jgi:hypothetical protein
LPTPVRPIHLHADAGQVPGQAHPVAAGPFDAGQGDGPRKPGSQSSSSADPAAVAGNSRTPAAPELLVSELTTNAVQASAPIADAAIGLWLASDCERSVILVWDPSPQPSAPANRGQETENGRGLVQVLNFQWGLVLSRQHLSRRPCWQGGLGHQHRVKRPCPPLAAK